MKFHLRLHDAQLDVLNRRKRFNHLRIGRRWGKTILNFALVTEPAAKRGLPTAYITPTADDYAKRWHEYCHFMRPLIKHVRVSEGLITLRSGGTVTFGGLHRFDGLRGNHFARVCIDEAAHSPNLREAWEYVIMPTLADLRGDAYFTSTPKGTNYFYEIERDHKLDPAYAFFHLPSSTNPKIDPDEIEMQRRTLPSSVFRQEWLAEYIDLEGALIRREWMQWGEPTEIVEIVMGVDLAISTKTTADYTACVVLGKDSKGIIWVLDAQRVQASFYGLLDFIIAMYQKHNPSNVIVETVQFQASVAEVLIGKGLPIQKVTPDKDKVARFRPVEGGIEHGFIKFRRGLINEFTDELLSFPQGSHDDMADAFAYAHQALTQSFFIFSV